MSTYETLNKKNAANALVWTRAGHSMIAWRLVSRGRVYATFTFQDSAQTCGVLRTSHGEWTIEQSFAGPAPHIALRDAVTDEEIAAFRPASTGNGRIEFASGPSFRWLRPSMSLRPCTIVTLKGGPVATVGKPLGNGAGPVTVLLSESASEIPELTFLLALGLYTSLRQSRGTLDTQDADCLEDTVALMA